MRISEYADLTVVCPDKPLCLHLNESQALLKPWPYLAYAASLLQSNRNSRQFCRAGHFHIAGMNLWDSAVSNYGAITAPAHWSSGMVFVYSVRFLRLCKTAARKKNMTTKFVSLLVATGCTVNERWFTTDTAINCLPKICETDSSTIGQIISGLLTCGPTPLTGLLASVCRLIVNESQWFIKGSEIFNLRPFHTYIFKHLLENNC